MHVGVCQPRLGTVHHTPSDIHVHYFSPRKPLNAVSVPCDFLQAGYHARILHIFYNAPVQHTPCMLEYHSVLLRHLDVCMATQVMYTRHLAEEYEKIL